MKKTIFLLVLLISASLFSQQTNFDKYQYIIVADKFDFLKETDQYQTSSLTKFLLKKKGFKVFLSNETLPEDLLVNRCLGLFATVIDESSLFVIKNSIQLKDCYGITLFTSDIGKSKEKDFKKGYQEAIRIAYDSMTDFKYTYSASLVDSIKIVKKEAVIIDKQSNTITTPIIAETTDIIIEVKEENTTPSKTLDVLYAQKITNGFQLVNTKPEVVFLILKTNVKDVFIINNKNGTLYKSGENWIAEFYENNLLVTKEYQIKF
ncbi:hypothetical protein BTO16_08305 [Polaribacter glomeratus]|uniref:Uncharacterized protein n=1 Tax=Polaribacter glomeratus TaxID=102 RepID=A0A2S7WZJ5_9FLAO|nr:hypothetical protein BTO16_08305 [Polaribacter glomeratus]